MATIDSYDFKGKRAIVRVDFNVPLDENGKITEMGTHDELMAQGGGYAKMFEIQSYYYKKKGQRAPLAEEGA